MVPEISEQSHEELVLSFLVESEDEFTSGEALSGKLGLSKADVWKHVESLRHKGYRIDAVPSRGYRLVTMPDRLSPLELSPRLNTHDLARRVHYFDELASTNATAVELAQAGAVHGEVVISEAQTQGRGRRGRSWSSPAGLNLYCSAVLRPDLPSARAPELTLVAAVAVAEWLRDSGVSAAIKWPNDILVGERKLAGLLTELSADGDRVQHAILGIGVNLNAQAIDFPSDVAERATSVRLALGKPVYRAGFAAGLFNRLEEWLDLHEEVGFAPVREAWRELSSTLGQDVLVKMQSQELLGRAEDIDDSGALLVRPAAGGDPVRVVAGDVEQLRSRAARASER